VKFAYTHVLHHHVGILWNSSLWVSGTKYFGDDDLSWSCLFQFLRRLRNRKARRSKPLQFYFPIINV